MWQVDRGFSSAILRTPDGRGVRAALTAEAARRHRIEAALLPTVAETVRVDIPCPMEFLAPTSDLPYGAWAMPWLDGVQVDASVAPDSVAGFLCDLWSGDVGAVEPITGPFAGWCESRRRLEADGLEALQGRLDDGLWRDLAAMLGEVGPLLGTCERPALIHGDLWYGNLLMIDGRLSGVLDWECAAVGDPLADLAGLWSLGDAFMAEVCERLGTKAYYLPDRIRYHRIIREFYGVTWSVEQEDAAELAESVAKVEAVARAVLD